MRDDILDKGGEQTFSTLIDVQEISKVSAIKFLAERSILSYDGCTILDALTPHIHRLSAVSTVHGSSHDTLCTITLNVAAHQETIYLHNELYVIEIVCNQILLSTMSLKTRK